MAIKDILLPLVGDPSPAAIAAIDKCVAMAADVGALISAVAVEVDLAVRPLVAISTDLDNAETIEATRSVSRTRELLQAFEAASLRLDARAEQVVLRLAQQDIAVALARRARLTDLSLLPMKAHDAQSQQLAEQLIFESGRPVLLCPEEFADRLSPAFDRVAIAWDHTAEAARAVADALPLLQSAASVQIFTVTDTASPAERESGTALATHLALHGVKASFEIVGRGGSSVGKVFEAFVHAHAIDLLVMGAYRHSPLNQRIWGGASNTIIGRPPCWVMMSH